jgi:hypothetical protein
MQRLIKFGHELAAPLIETESYAMRRLNGGTLQKAYHFGHEFRRHPVRCEQAHVLEDMEHSTFARAGEAGESAYPHSFWDIQKRSPSAFPRHVQEGEADHPSWYFP